MSFSVHPSKAGEVHIRRVEAEDISSLIDLNNRAFPLMHEENVVWSERQLSNHLKVFPAGQLVALISGRIVGAVASLIVKTDRDPYRPHTYGGITDGGYFHNHDPTGDTLYGADVYVDPDLQKLGIGAALYEARRALCRQLNLRRILAGGRLAGYSAHAAALTPEEYVRKVVGGDRRQLIGQFLGESFLLRVGFERKPRDHLAQLLARGDMAQSDTGNDAGIEGGGRVEAQVAVGGSGIDAVVDAQAGAELRRKRARLAPRIGQRRRARRGRADQPVVRRAARAPAARV